MMDRMLKRVIEDLKQIACMLSSNAGKEGYEWVSGDIMLSLDRAIGILVKVEDLL